MNCKAILVMKDAHDNDFTDNIRYGQGLAHDIYEKFLR